ncbi:MAG: glycoside hydrolase [Acetanaerobacterium sp.]
MTKNDNTFEYEKKIRRKGARTVLQVILLLAVVIAIALTFFNTRHFQPINPSLLVGDEGFITVSYFGVDRTLKPSLIDNEMLLEQLASLKESGYVTISQQDILNYYNGGKLPEKALYLIFEDGRKDSAMFAQPILEKLNYKATMLSYANKFIANEQKFLQPKDLLEMADNSFWELGSNGYRFEYINVFDRFDNFLGRLDQDQFAEVSKYIVDDYNHYLMDFLSDEDRVPVETREQMEARLTWDYNKMNSIYTKQLGFVPDMYAIMHEGGLGGTNSELVSSVNLREAQKIFTMAFNREGNSLNTTDNALFDLTRLQTQNYWYTNHLLMRIEADTGNPMAFRIGDQQRAKWWSVVQGRTEFRDGKIVLTTPPDEAGVMYLNGSRDYQNLFLSTTLEGNVVGEQTIYLRCDTDNGSYIRITLRNNVLYLYEKEIGKDQHELASIDLRTLDALPAQSVEEVKREAQLTEAQLVAKTSLDKREVVQANTIAAETETQTAPTVEDGAEEFIPGLSIHETGSRKLEVTLYGNMLTVLVDGKVAAEGVSVSAAIERGWVCLYAIRNELNTSDDVYDGVFNDLLIQKPRINARNSDTLFDNRLGWFEQIIFSITSSYDAVIDWFIETF